MVSTDMIMTMPSSRFKIYAIARHGADEPRILGAHFKPLSILGSVTANPPPTGDKFVEFNTPLLLYKTTPGAAYAAALTSDTDLSARR